MPSPTNSNPQTARAQPGNHQEHHKAQEREKRENREHRSERGERRKKRVEIEIKEMLGIKQ